LDGAGISSGVEMNRARLLKLAVAAGAAGAAAAAGGLVLAGRRWAAADDPDAATRLTVPDGEDLRIPTSDGGEIAGTVAGDDGGRLFVLVHGWTNDRRIWAPVARILVERGNRVVLYDQRGHGTSREGSDGLTIEALGADMRAVLEHIDARDAVVAGHSMGGMAAQAFAIDHADVVRERVAGLALVSTGCSNVGVSGPRGKFAPRLLGSNRINRFVSHAHLGPVFVRSTMGRRATLTNLRAMQDTFVATTGASRRGFLEAMNAMDFSESLGAVDVRVVVISGTRDQLIAHSNTRRLAEVIDGARFQALPELGHMVPLETPDTVADILEDLAATSPASDRAERTA
jgi:pimeloyl-ACP methyl ester carboxylesterase